MHPLAKQAAKYYSHRESAYLHLQLHTSEIPSGQYVFSVYAWQYTGYNTYTKLITVCENEKIAVELPFLLEDADSSIGQALKIIMYQCGLKPEKSIKVR